MNDPAKELARKASLMVVGGFRPPADPLSSWFGRVMAALPGEAWPHYEGEPLAPLCQINCAELPYRPPSLSDVALLTVFIAENDLPMESTNGRGWALRAYPSVADLVVIEEPEFDRTIRPFPIRWELCEHDYPSFDDVPAEVRAELGEEFYELLPNQDRSKIGGWPTLIQSEIYWAPWNIHPANPEYVFQINSEEKADWWWGDAGVGHFGRGTGAARDQWLLAWQCY